MRPIKKHEGVSTDAKKVRDTVFHLMMVIFINDHWDEMRIIGYEKGFVSNENADCDIHFVFVVESYNAKSVLAEIAEVYID